MSNYYVGDVGTIIILDVGADVSEATAMLIKVKKPSGTEAEWSAEIGPPTATGEYTKIMHVIEGGEWDEPGTWTIQAYVEIGDWKGHGDSVKFKLNTLFT
jgi:hypothetical protein